MLLTAVPRLLLDIGNVGVRPGSGLPAATTARAGIVDDYGCYITLLPTV